MGDFYDWLQKNGISYYETEEEQEQREEKEEEIYGRFFDRVR